MLRHERRSIDALLLLLMAALGGCVGDAVRCGGDRCYDYITPIPGSGSVSGGSATYRIDITVPPGRDDMVPSISVNSSTRDGNSVLGESWSLSATSSLYRCGARLLEDGYSAGLDYQATDKLCLDGGHLIAYRGQYGRSGTLYRTRSDLFLQVREFGDLQDPKVYFVATGENGVRWYYDVAQTQVGAEHPLTWFASRKEDQIGNVVTYNYVSPFPGNKLISEIRYTGRDKGDHIEPGTRWVKFNYEPRPDNFGGYLSGGEGVINQRLASIITGLDVEVDGKRVARSILEYGFSYRQSANSGRSLLTTVRECAHGASGVRYCRLATTFTWDDKPIRYADPLAYSVPGITAGDRRAWRSEETAPQVAPYTVSHDYDGDGRDEIVFYKAGASAHLLDVDIDGKLLHDVDLKRYIQQPSPQWVDAMGPDVHHLGGAEVVGESAGSMSFAQWKGAGVGRAEATAIPWSPDLVIGTFNGTGSADVLESQIIGDQYIVSYYVNRGVSSLEAEFDKPVEVLRMPVEHDPSQVLSLKAAGGLQNDFGLDAFVMSGKMIRKIILFRQNRDGSPGFRVVDPVAFGISDQAQADGIIFADINADGAEDIVYSEGAPGALPTWRYQVNTEHGFAPPVDTGVLDERGPAAKGSATIVADIASDGRDAILYPDSLLVDYCLPSGTAAGASGGYSCSSTGLDRDRPDLDFGIYRFAALQFDMRLDGALVPSVLRDTNIIAQAHLASTGDLQGDGIVDFLSPFDPWFSDGRFRTKSGALNLCPEGFGCGLHVSSSVLTSRDDRLDAVPDLMVGADHGNGYRESWSYYPLSSVKAGLYSIPAPDSSDRFVDPYAYYFSTSMYVVGEFTQDAYTISHYRYGYGGGIYNGAEGFFEGFRWVEVHDLANAVKYVNWFDQSFPFADDELRRSWTERESASGDDLLNGIPDPHFLSQTAYGVDCQGPVGTAFSIAMHCVDSGSPSYHQRTRSVETTTIALATGEGTITDQQSYDYDLYGHQTHSSVLQTDGSFKETDSRYAPPDLDDWWVDKLENRRISVNQPPNEGHGPSTQLVSDTLYEYGPRRLLKAKEITNPKYRGTVREVFDYDLDPDSPSFGDIKSIEFSMKNDTGEFQPLEHREFTYSADGYFIEAVEDSTDGTTRYQYDPATGNLLLKVGPDGRTEQHHYDVFGNDDERYH